MCEAHTITPRKGSQIETSSSSSSSSACVVEKTKIDNLSVGSQQCTERILSLAEDNRERCIFNILRLNRGDLSRHSGIAVRWNGDIYATNVRHHCIEQFRGDGVFVREWGSYGKSEGKFDTPRGIAIGTHDRIKGSILCAFKSIPSLRVFPPGLLPICAAYLGEECLHVVDWGNRRMQTFEPDGTFLYAWGRYQPATKGSGILCKPTQCVVYPHDDKIYVCYDKGYVRCFRSNMLGKCIWEWQFPDVMGEAISLCADPMGMLYAASTEQGFVAQLEKDGSGMRSLTHVAKQPLALSADDFYVYIADAEKRCVFQCRTDGTLVRTLGEGHLDNPVALTKGPNDILYVADSGICRIVVFRVC